MAGTRGRIGGAVLLGMVSVLAPGCAPPPTQTHCGSLSGDETWTNAAIHVVTCTVTVDAGRTLTLASGTVVKSTTTTTAILAQPGSRVVAQGTADRPVTFTVTEDDTVGGDTNGDGGATSPQLDQVSLYGAAVQVHRDSTTVLDHVAFRWRSGYAVAGVPTRNETPAGSLIIRDSTVRQSHGAVQLDLTGLRLVAVSGMDVDQVRGIHGDILVYSVPELAVRGNVFGPDRRGPAIQLSQVAVHNVPVDGGPDTNTFAGPPAARVVAVTEHASVPAGQVMRVDPASGLSALVTDKFGVHGELTVAPGTVVKSSTNSAGIVVNPGGRLSAKGTADAPITFTDLADDTAAGDTNGDGTGSVPVWDDVRFGSAVSVQWDATVDIDHADLRWMSGYAVSGQPWLNAPTDGRVTVTNSSIRHSRGAVSMDFVGLRAVTLTDNRFDELDGIDGHVRLSQVPTVVVARNTFGPARTGPAMYLHGIDVQDVALDGAGTNRLEGSPRGRVVVLREGARVPAGRQWIVNPASGISALESARFYLDGTAVLLPGTVVKSGDGQDAVTVNANGRLFADGTPEHPVIFTAAADGEAGGATGSGSPPTPSTGDVRAHINVYEGGLAHVRQARFRYADVAVLGTDWPFTGKGIDVSESWFRDNRRAIDFPHIWQSTEPDCGYSPTVSFADNRYGADHSVFASVEPEVWARLTPVARTAPVGWRSYARPGVRDTIPAGVEVCHRPESPGIPAREESVAASPVSPSSPSGQLRTGAAYVAIGDSYAAGEGLGEYDAGTETISGPFANTCHRSGHAYARLNGASGKPVVRPSAETRSFWACSGAETNDVDPRARAELADRPFGQPFQVDTVGPGTRWVSISVGGNDVLFGDIIRACTVYYAAGVVQTIPGTVHRCSDRVQAGLAIMNGEGADGLASRLRTVYRDILDRAPAARLAVAGYPRFFPEQVSGLPIVGRGAVVDPGAQQFCVTNDANSAALLFGVTDVDGRAINGFVAQLNTTIRRQIESVNAEPGRAGRITFVDTHSSSVPHNCTGITPNVTVNAVMFSPGWNGIPDHRYLSSASYHPTTAGQAMFARRVEEEFVRMG